MLTWEFFRSCKAEVRDTDFPSPSQLSVPFAEVETADSPRVGSVSPRCRKQKNTGLPCISYSCCANVHPLGVLFVWVLHRSHIAFLGRDIIALGVSLKSINQPINLTCFVLFQNLAPLLEGGLQGRTMKSEQKNTSKKGRNAGPGKDGNCSSMTYECIVWRVFQRMRGRIRRSRHLGGIW